MGWFEGLLGGFQGRQDQVRQQEMEQANADADRESRVYSTLLNSPDPEIASMAAAGLLESAGPRKRKSGFSGWLGDMQQSPTYAKLQQLIQSPTQTSAGTPPSLPHTNYPVIAAAPPGLGDGPANMPDQSLTQPGAAPPKNLPTPAPVAVPGNVGKPPTFGPRHVFASPEETYAAQARGKAQGDVEGDIAGYMAAGMSREAAVAQVRAERVRAGGGAAGAGAQSIAGEVVGPDGRTVPAFGVFDRARGVYLDPDTHEPLAGFRPRTTTGSTSMGADREAIARELYNMPFVQLNQTQQATVNSTAIGRTRDVAYNRGIGTGQAKIATELASPIGPSMARQYNVSPTTTLGELANTVGLTDEQKSRVYAIGQIDGLVDDIDALIPQVFPNVPEGFAGKVKSALSLGVQRFSGDQQLATLDASINAALAQVAQLSGQPGSRLSDKDIELAKSTLANLQPSLFNGDTINTAKARVQVIKNLLDKAKGSIPTSPQIATPPPGGAPRPQAAAPARGTGTPPPTAATASGPAGWFVVDGKLVNKGAGASAP